MANWQAFQNKVSSGRSVAEDVSTRRAGWSALVDANLRPAAPGSTSQNEPARNPCRAHNDCMQPLRPPEYVLTDGVVSLRVPREDVYAMPHSGHVV